MELLMVLQPKAGLGHPLILHALETAVNVIREQKCIGIGSFLADYILDRVLENCGGKYHLIAVAAYLLREVRENIDGCGKDSTIWFFGPNDGVKEKISYSYIDRLEHETELLNATMRDVFSYATDIGNVYDNSDFTAIEEDARRRRLSHKDALLEDKEIKAELQDQDNEGVDGC